MTKPIPVAVLALALLTLGAASFYKDLDLKSAALKVDGTTVIDSSRNLKNLTFQMFSLATATKTNGYTMTGGETTAVFYCDATGASVAIITPSSVTIGRVFEMFKIDGSANSCSFQAAMGHTLSGASIKTTSTRYNGFRILGQSSTNWIATQLNTP